MMRPQPFSSMSSMTCLVTWNRLFKLVSMTSCHCSLVILRNRQSRVIPALLISTSAGPCSARTFSKAARVESQFETLPSEAYTS